jgi:hypothetical protein
MDAGLAKAHEKPLIVERALLADIKAKMGDSFDARRFIPFVVMHEFEALLFSDCDAFSRGVGKPDLAPYLIKIRNAFNNPEEINDSPITAPSKRVEALMPHYQKPLLGTLAALEIGLERIRAECPHFAFWISHLESIADL